MKTILAVLLALPIFMHQPVYLFKVGPAGDALEAQFIRDLNADGLTIDNVQDVKLAIGAGYRLCELHAKGMTTARLQQIALDSGFTPAEANAIVTDSLKDLCGSTAV
jgi:hypothetical protein